MPHPGRRRRRYEVLGFRCVALTAACAVDDDLGPVHSGFDSLAGGQVTGHTPGGDQDHRTRLGAVADRMLGSSVAADDARSGGV